MITVNTSYTNLVSQHTLTKNTNALQKATERLSTGVRINHASDDAAGVFLDVSLNSQISSMKTANDNNLLATNFLNIANGTLTTVSDCLMRMNDLATQACNGVLSDDARNTLQSEMNALSAQIDQSIAGSNMNGVNTIDRSNMSADLMNKVDVKSLDDLKADGYIACTADNMSVSANKKFYISSAEELQNLATAVNTGNVSTTSGKTFMLANDIDLSSVCSEELGVSWTTIGGVIDGTNHYLAGTFDGNGHVISNLYINNPDADYQGLFGLVAGYCEVKNLGVENAKVTGNERVGALAGSFVTSKSITNCYTTGCVTGNRFIGGFVGQAGGGATIESCYSECNVTGLVDATGGLVGYAHTTTIKNSYATGDVAGKSIAGGLVGTLTNNSSVENCYATGNLTGQNYLGGLIGYAHSSSSAKNSYATGNINGTAGYNGGLIGHSYDSFLISNCYASGNVTGSDGVGGLVGWTVATTCENSYATGNANGTSNISATIGIIGSDATKTNCYGTGSANGVAADLTDKENFDKGVLDSKLWDLTGDNPKLKCCGVSANKVSIRMQVGDTADETSSIAYDSYFRLNLDNLDLSTVESARKTLAKLQSNIEDVTMKQSYIGTQINRLSDIYNSQQIRIENVSAAKSTISDTDYAKEVANMVKSQILQQISVSVLTQSQNISGKIALSLL